MVLRLLRALERAQLALVHVLRQVHPDGEEGGAMKARRVAVLRLLNGQRWSGKYDKAYAIKPVQFYVEDAWRFLKALGPITVSDYFWGVSLELLPKRKKYSPLSTEGVDALIAKTVAARCAAWAALYEGRAKSYEAQSEIAKQMAIQFRELALKAREGVR